MPFIPSNTKAGRRLTAAKGTGGVVPNSFQVKYNEDEKVLERIEATRADIAYHNAMIDRRKAEKKLRKTLPKFKV